MNGIPSRFPFRLHKMLEEAEAEGLENLIAWLPCGTKFRIRNQGEFSKTIMSKYCRHSKYKSFLRQLSMYKFQRISSGPSKGCYFHPHFIRHRLDLAELINRENIAKQLPEALVDGKIIIKGNSKTESAADLLGTRSLMDRHFTASSIHGCDEEYEIVKPMTGSQRICGIVEVEEDDKFAKPRQQQSFTVSSHEMTADDIVDEIIFTFRFA